MGELVRLCRVSSFGGYFAKIRCATCYMVASTELRLTADRLNMLILMHCACRGLRRHVRVDGRQCGSRSSEVLQEQISRRGMGHPLLLLNHNQRMTPNTSRQCVCTNHIIYSIAVRFCSRGRVG